MRKAFSMREELEGNLCSPGLLREITALLKYGQAMFDPIDLAWQGVQPEVSLQP